MRRWASPLRAVGTLALGGLCIAYILWKIDVGETAHVLANANLPDFLLASAITIGAVLPLTWRWQQLLAARGVHERYGWLLRTSFTSIAFAQVLPTSLGGDASRIFATSRRHRERRVAPSRGPSSSNARSAGSRRCCSRPSASCSRSDATTSAPTCGSRPRSSSRRSLLVFVLFSRRARGPLARYVGVLRALRLERPLAQRRTRDFTATAPTAGCSRGRSP